MYLLSIYGFIHLSMDFIYFCAISARHQLTLYEKLACDVKPKLLIFVLTL